MKRRCLGRTDVELSVVGFGAGAVGGGRDYAVALRDETDAVATIIRALECGINWIDTAPKYADGYAEELVGKALAEWGEEVFVATKCGYPYDENSGKPMPNLKAETIYREIDESLSRIGVERIDLYQIHWPYPDEDIEEAYAAVADLVHRGKVRFAGVSNFSVEQMRRVESIHPIASLQPPYSMLRRDIEDGVLEYCSRNGIGVLVYSPMQSGLLSGSFSRERIDSLPKGDWRRWDKNFCEPELTANLARIEKLKHLAADAGLTLPELAIAWTFRDTAVTAAIVGARTPDQIGATSRAGEVTLDADLIAHIETILLEGQE